MRGIFDMRIWIFGDFVWFFDICISNFGAGLWIFCQSGTWCCRAGRFVGTPSRQFCGALQAFWGKGISAYGPALQGCTAALYGADKAKEKPRFSAGRGLSVICCGWAFGIVLYPQDNRLRVFQRCGRAFSSGLVRLRRRLTARPTRHFWRQCGGRGRLFQ